MVEQTIDFPVIWDTMAVMLRHFNHGDGNPSVAEMALGTHFGEI